MEAKKEDYCVKAIDREAAKDFFLKGHYLHKWPRISFLFGLFCKDELVGAVSYGTPSSPAVKKSLAGVEYANIVIELNRLFLKNNIKNEASILISNSIKLLPQPLIIVSYADTFVDHIGTIYKASNFQDGGESESYHFDWKVKGKEHLHQSTLFREFKHSKNKLSKMKEKYGDLLYKEKRSSKKRYFFIHANRKDKKNILNKLNLSTWRPKNNKI
jgi:hypothetical protein